MKLNVFKDYNRFLKKVAVKQNRLHLKTRKRIYLSFGENCLPDNILNRYGLKSFSTPFSHGRSNIEYILQLEAHQYENYVNDEYLTYEMLNEDKVVRLKIYKYTDNSYDWRHMNGFEFTHHDIIQNSNLKEVFKKRAARLKSFINEKTYIILYYHRSSKSTDLDLLMEHLNQLKIIYTGKMKAEIVLFKQVVVPKSTNKSLDYYPLKGIHVFDFCTHDFWEGENPSLLWAYNDEALIKKMIKIIKKI